MAEELWHLSCLQQERTMAMKEATLQGEPVPVLTHPRGHHRSSYLQPDPVPARPTVGELWGQGWVAGGCVRGGEMSAMHKKTCRTVVTARNCCPSGRAPNKVPPPRKELISWPPSQAGDSNSENVAVHEASRGQEEKGTQNKTS